MSYLQKNFFAISILLLVAFTAIFSFNRFILQADYVVEYKVSCDPTINSCFVGCNDELCADQYTYAKVSRQATNIKKLCGKDITDCEAAQYCEQGENSCEVKYCEGELSIPCTGGSITTESAIEETESPEPQ